MCYVVVGVEAHGTYLEFVVIAAHGADLTIGVTASSNVLQGFRNRICS
jgi:hypothetical protein